MKAYAIFDGGGVLGAALAGALKAAEDQRVEFVGFGGTSAGGIVATLAAVGYKGHEIERLLVETELTDFLHENGKHVEAFKSQVSSLVAQASTIVGGSRKPVLGPLQTILSLWSAYRGAEPLREALTKNRGVDNGQALKAFLLNKIREKQPSLSQAADISFADLAQREAANGDAPCCRPLKIVASDVTRRCPAVFSSGDTLYGGSVLDAVRASACYPFVFQPFDLNSQCWLVDGGLASNLPTFLFQKEQQRTRYPVLAFDLVKAPAKADNYNLMRYLDDMMSTALEASDTVIRDVLDGVAHVRIKIPEKFSSLDFKLGREEREHLFQTGYAQARVFLDGLDVLKRANRAADVCDGLRESAAGETAARERFLQAQLQARYGDPKLFAAVLSAVAQEIERETAAEDVRVSIMLRTGVSLDGEPTRMVVYSYGMCDADPDSTLEMAETGGCSGQAWFSKRPAIADLEEAADAPDAWNMTPQQQARIPPDRKSMLSIPIWDHPDAERDPGSVPIGTLSIDSKTPLTDTSWVGPKAGLETDVVARLFVWENVIRKLFN